MRFLLVTVLVVVFTVAALLVWFLFFYVPRPEVPPLAIAPDDPLMADAMRKAVDSPRPDVWPARTGPWS